MAWLLIHKKISVARQVWYGMFYSLWSDKTRAQRNHNMTLLFCMSLWADLNLNSQTCYEGKKDKHFSMSCLIVVNMWPPKPLWCVWWNHLQNVSNVMLSPLKPDRGETLWNQQNHYRMIDCWLPTIHGSCPEQGATILREGKTITLGQTANMWMHRILKTIFM